LRYPSAQTTADHSARKEIAMKKIVAALVL
jgi:hypothetical protein